MRTLVALAIVAACTRPMTNAGGALSTAVPSGWVAIEPDDDRLRCASMANDEWQVSFEDGTLSFTEANQRARDTGPALPFTPPPRPGKRGRQHVLAVADGFLVGVDVGEWGGELTWFSSDGTSSEKLGDNNVHGLVAIGPTLVASIEGLSHETRSRGNVRWIDHTTRWRAGAVTALDAAPRTFVATTDAIYVLTTKSLTRVDTNDHTARTIQSTKTSRMYPGSMTIDLDGSLWIGMRQFVLRMSPNGDRFTQTWLVRSSCVRATVRDDDCQCE